MNRFCIKQLIDFLLFSSEKNIELICDTDYIEVPVSEIDLL